MTNVWTRVIFYILCGIASGLALGGFASFDPATGAFDLEPFNLYQIGTFLGGPVAAIAAFMRWGTK